VRRQIDWLADAGWEIDTLGLGPHPDPRVGDHHVVRNLPRWSSSRLAQLALYLLVPARARFRVLATDRFPEAVSARLRDRAYGAVVFNEIEFIPWVIDRKLFDPATTHIHLDLHEFHEPTLTARTRWARLTARHYRWIRSHIGRPEFASRSTVASGIARLYEEEFGVETLFLVRNAPPYVDLQPSPVDPDAIRLLFHGMASWARGLTQIVEAFEGLDPRFSMTFMLTPPQRNIDRLQALIDEKGLGDRMRIVPPSPMREIARNINEHDLEIVFYPSTTTNVRLALPNKIFEAVQGRLGLVIGHSPMLEEVVTRYGNGVVVDGWQPADLRAALESLDAAAIVGMKQASAAAARELNAENEGRVFLSALGILPGPAGAAGAAG